ncbi:hypothetical protein DYI37_07000 [Fulvimarina endophytica]|uniref:Lipid/polyisoprenoid-binding YceI-like domain-containing protein n=1 Tax=Fulvimarina endophytica TaxID=2293836 RepID=A0A371X4Z2_9HYPH|nr:cytochrome b/b6 domain-containing protein [Fulvimarina endophytica]RFC64104.1 hypothetical protein DYI37_07000 [Fulvimarina endophytica]
MSMAGEQAAWRAAYTRYTRGAVILHWTIAALILGNIAGGLLFSYDLLPDAVRFPVIQFHKTIGLLVLALSVARILWRVMNPPPAHAPVMARSERIAAHLVHILFYALMILVPLFGWLVVSASAARVPTYLFMIEALPWPSLPIREAVNETTREHLAAFFDFSHKWLALAFLGLLALHVAGAAKHHMRDKLPSFSRMGLGSGLARARSRPGAVPLALSGFALVLAIGLLAGQAETGASGQASAPDAQTAVMGESAGEAASGTTTTGDWTIEKSESRLGFETSFSGAPMEGTVSDYDADIVFSPDDLASARAEILIRTASIATANAFVAPQLQGPDGFASKDFPEARLVLDTFRQAGSEPNAFEADGQLTLRGKTHPVTLAFTFVPGEGDTARVAGSTTIDRTLYGIGVSNDPTGRDLAREVTVRFDLAARRTGS